MAVWDTATWREIVRTRPLGKAACNGLAGSLRAGACTGAEPSLMITCGDKPGVWGMYVLACVLRTVDAHGSEPMPAVPLPGPGSFIGS